MVELRLTHLTVDLEALERHIGAPLPHHESIQTISKQLSGLKTLVDSHSKTQAEATQTLIQAGR